MLRPDVPYLCAIVFRLSPFATVTTRNVGAGVGVGGTKDAGPCDPVGDPDGTGEPAAATDVVGLGCVPAASEAVARDPAGRQPTATITRTALATASTTEPDRG